MIKVPVPLDSSQEPEESFALKVLRDISSLRLDESQETSSLISDAKTMEPNIVKSSYFQWLFLSLLKQILSFQTRSAQTTTEANSIISNLLKIVIPDNN